MKGTCCFVPFIPALAYARHYPIEVRVARFQNCYGPEGTWRGGREKAPAAICRKVAMAENGSSIPVWGDGTAVRAYTYVDDLMKGIYMLMQADPARHPELVEGPGGMLAIIGGDEYVTVDEAAALTGDGDRGFRQGDSD
jgi:nucleoside-diphosphate-sugar epimerase